MNAYLIEGHKYRTHINEISPRLEWIGGLDDKAAKLEVFVEPVWTSADRARALRIRNKYAHEFRSISPTGDVTFSKSVGRRKHRERTEPFLSLLVDWKDALNITSQLQICMTVSWICPTCKQNVPNATPCDGCSDHYTVPTNTPATIHMRFQNARMTSIPPTTRSVSSPQEVGSISCVLESHHHQANYTSRSLRPAKHSAIVCRGTSKTRKEAKKCPTSTSARCTPWTTWK